MDETDAPTVSVVIPARNEATYLEDCLRSVAALEIDVPHEVLVVDGNSDDATPAIARAFDATVVDGPGEGIGRGRDLGARHASGEWLAFVDADTTLDPAYLDAMLAFVREAELDAASSRCRMDGLRASLVAATINHVFPRMEHPIIPGFNFFVRRSVYEAAGGFPSVPNEDTAFSRRLATEYDTGYHPDVLVETSGRRVRRYGLTGTLLYYLWLDVQRVLAPY